MAKLILKTDRSSVSFEIGTEDHRRGCHIHIYAGGNDFKSGKSAYEVDKGFIILEALPRIISKWGRSSWTTSLAARDSSVETIENIRRYFEEIMKAATERGDERNEQMASWVQKQILDYYYRYSSRNARFEVYVECQSEEVRISLPFRSSLKVDTKTANLEMDFTFRVLKLITPEEMGMIHSFMTDAIEKGLAVDYEYI